MRRALLVLLVLLGCASVAAAQTTVVTATTIDSQSTPYINGTWSVNLVNPTTFQPIWQGTTNFVTSFGGATNATGGFTTSLPSNTGTLPITVGGLTTTQYAFFVCASDGGSCYTSTVTITGATQNVTLTNAGRITFTVGEAHQPPCGAGQSVVAVSGTLSGCGSSSGSGITPATLPSGNVLYLAQGSCPSSNPANCFATPWNTRQINNCGWTSGFPDITCPVGSFTVADVGKNIAAFEGCSVSSFNSTDLGTAGATVATFVDSTHVKANTNATATKAATLQSCVGIGTPDDTATSAMDAAAQASSVCTAVKFPMGMGLWLQPHFFVNPPACITIPEELGGTLEVSGFDISGQGQYATRIWWPPNFNLAGCLGGPAGHACMGGFQFFLHDFNITGIGETASSSLIATTANLIENGPTSGLSDRYSKIENFSCSNLFQSAPNVNGYQSSTGSFHSAWRGVNIDGCGATCANITGGVDATNISIQDCQASQVTINASSYLAVNGGRSYFLNVTGNTASSPVITNNGGLLDCGNCYIFNQMGSGASYAYRATVTSTTLFRDSIVQVTSTSANAAFVQDSGIIHATNTTFQAPATSNAIAVTNSAKFYDGGGNSFSGGGSIAVTTGASIIADGHSLTGACTGTSTSSSTLGLYGTGPNVTAATCTSTNIGTGTVMTAARTLQGLVVNASHAGVSASSGVVTVLKNGSATAITCTIGTATFCSDGAHTVSTVAGDLISIQFTTQATEVLAGVNAFIDWN